MQSRPDKQVEVPTSGVHEDSLSPLEEYEGTNSATQSLSPTASRKILNREFSWDSEASVLPDSEKVVHKAQQLSDDTATLVIAAASDSAAVSVGESSGRHPAEAVARDRQVHDEIEELREFLSAMTACPARSARK